MEIALVRKDEHFTTIAMGSLAPEVETYGDEKEINVLVTGFGVRSPHPMAIALQLTTSLQPFLENKINPSYLIATALPKQLVIPDLPRINIHTYPNPIEVSYANVLATVPELLKRAYDLTLNIGMAPSRAYYTLETEAHCWGYEKRDVRGEIPNDQYWHKKYNSPPVLQPTYDPGDVCRRWKSVLMTEDVRLSDNAGKYLCDYIYYACMLEYWLRDPVGERPCAFLHVPGATEEEDILRGTKVAMAAIGAIVGSQIARRRAGKGIYAPDPFA